MEDLLFVQALSIDMPQTKYSLQRKQKDHIRLNVLFAATEHVRQSNFISSSHNGAEKERS